MSDRATVTVALQVEIAASVLQEVVKYSKEWISRQPSIGGPIDTADILNLMVSRFFLANDFERFIREEMSAESQWEPAGK